MSIAAGESDMLVEADMHLQLPVHSIHSTTHTFIDRPTYPRTPYELTSIHIHRCYDTQGKRHGAEAQHWKPSSNMRTTESEACFMT